MKRFILLLATVALFVSCGVGSYSVSSGKADQGGISFVDDATYEIVVNIDNQTYTLETVKNTVYKKDRKIKQTALNTIKLMPGQHLVQVLKSGEEVYNQTVFVSVGETKIVEL